MDDREFEARLSARLHRRFDGLAPSAELLGGVEQVLATRPRPIGLARLRAGRRELGWTALLAAAVIVALTVATGRLGGLLGPGGPTATVAPTPGATSTTRHFIVLPSSITLPDKPQAILANEVLDKRLQALGFGNFTSHGSIEIQYELEASGPSDEVVEDALRATGDVAFVPLPREIYGDQNGGSGLNLPYGQELPTNEPALFGWDGIESVEAGSGRTQPVPILTFKLKPAAAQAFADYTSSHQGELFAILIDGEVALVPAVNEAISDGMLSVTGSSLPEANWEVSRAILAGGKLPPEWSPAVVPHVRPAEDFIPQIQFETPGGTLLTAELGVFQSNIGFPWVAVWRLTFEGDFEPCPTADPLPYYCTPDGHHLVTVDVENGGYYP